MELVNTTQGQLSVFDYGDIATRYGDNVATELKSLEYEGTGILVDAKIKFGNVLRKGKALVSEGDFERWYTSVWDIKRQRVNDFMRIAEAHECCPESGQVLPEKLQPAVAMAKAILNAPEDKREELVGEIKEKREEKGKDLTEAEIKELPMYKKIEELKKKLQEKIKAEKKAKKELEDKNKQLEIGAEHKDRIIADRNKEWAEYLANKARIEEEQAKLKKEKEELDKWKKEKEDYLNDLALQKQELENTINKEVEVKIKEKQKEIDKTVNAKVKEKLEKEVKKLETERKKYEEQLKAIAKKQKEQQELNTKLDKLNRWIDGIARFNEAINNLRYNLTPTYELLTTLTELDRSVLTKEQNIYTDKQLQLFYDNSLSLTEMMDNTKQMLTKFNLNALEASTAEVNEVINIRTVELVD